MQKLATQDIDDELTDLPEWTLSGESLQRTYRFDGFVDSMEFVNRVAAVAEEHGHHPDILIRVDKVTLTLTTDEAGGVTDRDIEFARFIDG